MKLSSRLLTGAVVCALACSVASCSSDESKGGDAATATSSASPSVAPGSEVPVDRDYSGKLPAVSGEYGKGATISAGEGEEPKDSVIATTLKEGDGEKLAPTDIVLAHYVGTLWDGTVFDSSYDRGGDSPQPIAFSLQQVVPGWTHGLAGQRVGDRVELVIPPQWGYGQQAQGPIPANSTLVFAVDIIDRVDPKDTSALKSATPENSELPEGIAVEGDLGSEPTLTLSGEAPEASEAATYTISRGDGPEVTQNDYVLYHIVLGSWDTDKEPASSWVGPAVMTQTPIGEVEGITGMPVGSRVAVVLPGRDGGSPTVSVIDIVNSLNPNAK